MALSNDLLSQFARVLNNNSDKPAEKTVYGSIVEYGSTKYVRLDGSNIDTPISSTTDAGPGDRVMVMIKNHSAIVTGNITNPSASKNTVEGIIDDVAGKIDDIQVGARNLIKNSNNLMYEGYSFRSGIFTLETAVVGESIIGIMILGKE